jgi:hypothetical protein
MRTPPNLLTMLRKAVDWLREKLNPREAEDPLVAVLLWLLTLVTVFLLLWAPSHARGSDSAIRDAVLKGAGGVLLLLGSYFAARTLKQTAADQRANRALQAIQLLEHESGPVSKGARAMLTALRDTSSGKREEALRTAIKQALDAPLEPSPSERRQEPLAGNREEDV